MVLPPGGDVLLAGLTLRVPGLSLERVGASEADQYPTQALPPPPAHPLTRLLPPTAVRVPPSAHLALQRVHVVMTSCQALTVLVQEACNAWTFAPDIQVSDGRVFISQLTAANDTFSLTNVTLSCAAEGAPPPPLPCWALPVNGSQVLAHVFQTLRATVASMQTKPGVAPFHGFGPSVISSSSQTAYPVSLSVLLSLTAQHTALPDFLSTQPLPLDKAGWDSDVHIAFFARPTGQLSSRNAENEAIVQDTVASVLDLRYLAAFPVAFPNVKFPTRYHCPLKGGGSVAFHDLTLLNLPYPKQLHTWMDLTAVTGHVLACQRQVAVVGQLMSREPPLVQYTRCTLVLPAPEVEMWAAITGAGGVTQTPKAKSHRLYAAFHTVEASWSSSDSLLISTFSTSIGQLGMLDTKLTTRLASGALGEGSKSSIMQETMAMGTSDFLEGSWQQTDSVLTSASEWPASAAVRAGHVFATALPALQQTLPQLLLLVTKGAHGSDAAATPGSDPAEEGSSLQGILASHLYATVYRSALLADTLASPLPGGGRPISPTAYFEDLHTVYIASSGFEVGTVGITSACRNSNGLSPGLILASEHLVQPADLAAIIVSNKGTPLPGLPIWPSDAACSLVGLYTKYVCNWAPCTPSRCQGQLAVTLSFIALSVDDASIQGQVNNKENLIERYEAVAQTHGVLNQSINSADRSIFLDALQASAIHLLMPGSVLHLGLLTFLNMPSHPGPEKISAANTVGSIVTIQRDVAGDALFEGWVLPLWHWVFDRSDPAPQLFLTNVTLLLPQQEMNALQAAARVAHMLRLSIAQTSSVGNHSSFGGMQSADDAGASVTKLLSAAAHVRRKQAEAGTGLKWAKELSQFGTNLDTATALVAYALGSQLSHADAGGTLLQYSLLSFRGWSGQHVTLTSEAQASMGTARHIMDWDAQQLADHGELQATLALLEAAVQLQQSTEDLYASPSPHIEPSQQGGSSRMGSRVTTQPGRYPGLQQQTKHQASPSLASPNSPNASPSQGSTPQLGNDASGDKQRRLGSGLAAGLGAACGLLLVIMLLAFGIMSFKAAAWGRKPQSGDRLGKQLDNPHSDLVPASQPVDPSHACGKPSPGSRSSESKDTCMGCGYGLQGGCIMLTHDSLPEAASLTKGTCPHKLTDTNQLGRWDSDCSSFINNSHEDLAKIVSCGSPETIRSPGPATKGTTALTAALVLSTSELLATVPGIAQSSVCDYSLASHRAIEGSVCPLPLSLRLPPAHVAADGHCVYSSHAAPNKRDQARLGEQAQEPNAAMVGCSPHAIMPSPREKWQAVFGERAIKGSSMPSEPSEIGLGGWCSSHAMLAHPPQDVDSIRRMQQRVLLRPKTGLGQWVTSHNRSSLSLYSICSAARAYCYVPRPHFANCAQELQDLSTESQDSFNQHLHPANPCAGDVHARRMEHLLDIQHQLHDVVHSLDAGASGSGLGDIATSMTSNNPGSVQLLPIALKCDASTCLRLGIWHRMPVAVRVLPLGAGQHARVSAWQHAAVAMSMNHPHVVATLHAQACSSCGGRGVGACSIQRAEKASTPSEDQVAGASTTQEGVHDDALLLVQELCPLGSLQCLLSSGVLQHAYTRGGSWRALVLSLLWQVAAGMAYIHARGLAHGSLHAGNVLLMSLEAPQQHQQQGDAQVPMPEKADRHRRAGKQADSLQGSTNIGCNSLEMHRPPIHAAPMPASAVLDGVDTSAAASQHPHAALGLSPGQQLDDCASARVQNVTSSPACTFGCVPDGPLGVRLVEQCRVVAKVAGAAGYLWQPAAGQAAEPAGGMQMWHFTPLVPPACPASQADDVHAYGLILQQLCGGLSRTASSGAQPQAEAEPVTQHKHAGLTYAKMQAPCIDMLESSASGIESEHHELSVPQPPDGQLPCSFPPALAWLLFACLAHEPTERPSFGCIMQTLEGVVRAEGREG